MFPSLAWSFQQIQVQALNSGQGLVREYDGRCLVLLPRALLGGAENVATVGDHRTEAKELRSEIDPALVLMQAQHAGALSCNTFWDSGRRVVRLLEKSAEASLMLRRIDGEPALVELPISRIDEQFFYLSPPNNDAGALTRVSIGDLVRAGNDVLGMVVSHDETLSEVRVMRLDYLSQQFDQVVPQLVSNVTPIRVEWLPEAESVTIRVKEKIRRQPDEAAESLKVLLKGDRVELTGKVVDQPWFAVRLFGLEGFIPAVSVAPQP